jgi:hypothetical protein
MGHQLLTRDHFRSRVFARDQHRCVVPGCGAAAVDAHHILERALWTRADEFGGYYLANGASLCADHHRLAEDGRIPPDALRRWVGCVDRILPAVLAPDQHWDKWGKPVMMPQRSGMQVKYPSTPFLPWSVIDDPEQMVFNVSDLVGCPVVVTTKMDGANVKLTADQVMARNGDHADQPHFSRLKALHAGLRHAIPATLVVFGEWLCYTHSIPYRGDLALAGPLQVISIYDTTWDLFLGWEETAAIARDLSLPTVPVLWQGTPTVRWRLEHELQRLATEVITVGHEGVVVRSALPFMAGQFQHRVAKHVRPNHVQLPDGPRALTELNAIL